MPGRGAGSHPCVSLHLSLAVNKTASFARRKAHFRVLLTDAERRARRSEIRPPGTEVRLAGQLEYQLRTSPEKSPSWKMAADQHRLLCNAAVSTDRDPVGRVVGCGSYSLIVRGGVCPLVHCKLWLLRQFRHSQGFGLKSATCPLDHHSAAFRHRRSFFGHNPVWVVPRAAFRRLQTQNLPPATLALQRSRKAEIGTAAEPYAPESSHSLCSRNSW